MQVLLLDRATDDQRARSDHGDQHFVGRDHASLAELGRDARGARPVAVLVSTVVDQSVGRRVNSQRIAIPAQVGKFLRCPGLIVLQLRQA
ncbi:MAG: hypothetical protein ACLQVM_01560 [Terriglobia bacterium]